MRLTAPRWISWLRDLFKHCVLTEFCASVQDKDVRDALAHYGQK
jgi:hypothetical protein